MLAPARRSDCRCCKMFFIPLPYFMTARTAGIDGTTKSRHFLVSLNIWMTSGVSSSQNVGGYFGANVNVGAKPGANPNSGGMAPIPQ